MDQILSRVPDVRPIATWDFTAGKLPARVNFSRATDAFTFSKGTAANTSMGGYSAAVNQPRFFSHPTDGSMSGILLEQASTNMQTYSHSGANWSYGGGASQTARSMAMFEGIPGVVVSEGTGTQTAGGSVYVTGAAVPVSSGMTFTVSFIIERGTNPVDIILLQLQGTGMPTVSQMFFDTRTGVMLGKSTSEKYVISNLGTSVWRVSITVSGANAGNVSWVALPCDSSGNLGFTCTNRNFVIGHVQMEALPFPTSPILTTNSQVTRAADKIRLSMDRRYGNGISFMMEVARGFGADATIMASLLFNSTWQNSSKVVRALNTIYLSQGGVGSTVDISGATLAGSGYVIAGNLGTGQALALNGSVGGPKPGVDNSSTRWGTPVEGFSLFGEADGTAIPAVTGGSTVIKSLRIFPAEFNVNQLEALTR